MRCCWSLMGGWVDGWTYLFVEVLWVVFQEEVSCGWGAAAVGGWVGERMEG